MNKMKRLLTVVALVFGAAGGVRAELMVEFGYSMEIVAANQNGRGLTSGYVPFSMTEPRSPVEGTNYLGPVYYGGATGTIALANTGMGVANSTTISDYINISGTSTGVGSRLVGLVMFTNQSCTITQMTWSTRFGGTGNNQTNMVAFVIRKTDGSFYISEKIANRSTSTVRTNGNLSALAWYDYDPETDIDAWGSIASGLILSEVDAVGEWQDARTLVGTQMGIGINAFRAWGTTEALKNIEASPGSLNITEGTTNTFEVRLSSQPDSSVTVSVSRVSGDTSLVVLPDPTLLIFDTANWNVGQTVYVEAISDVDTNSGVATVACTDLGGVYNTRNVPVTQIDTTVVAPIAGFNGAPALGYAPLTVTFTDTSTGTITNRFWDFGDGETTNTMLTSVSHTYTEAGSTSTVQLTVSGPLGESTTNRLDYIHVLPGIPPALPIYDAFNDSVSTSAIPTGWFCLAPGVNAAHSRIDEGSLSYPGLQASEGNSFGLGNKTDDYSLMFTSPGLGNGETVYFSALLRFNYATPVNMNSGSLRLLDAADPFGSGIQVGFGVTNGESLMGFSLDNRNRNWTDSAPVKTPAAYTAVGETYLIVASYTRGTNQSHVADSSGSVKLWINPDSATFGTETPPAPILWTNSYASDANWNRLDILSAGSGSWPTNWQLDEVRVATNWAGVVPAYTEPPAEAPVITSALEATGTVNQPFSYQITADNSPAGFDAVGLPQGLSINTGSGAITGTPVAAGSNDVTISAWNIEGTDSQTLVLIVYPQAPVITGDLLATGTVGQAFSYQITADNDPDGFDAVGLPSGLDINTGSGAITGTPIAAGSNEVTISASNAGGTDSRTLVVVISPADEPVADSDGDGLPDEWEQLYFGGATNANPAAVCANGINTVLEAYIAGLNPTNPSSVFRTAGTPPGLLSWNTASGRVYAVYASTNLMSGFACIASNLPWTQNSLTNPAPAASSFYKIDVRLE